VVGIERGNAGLHRFFSFRAPPLGRWAAILGFAALFAAPPSLAVPGPFANFNGAWSGNGTLRPTNGAAERIRCNASYRVRDSNSHEIDLQLRCASDSYNFQLSGEFEADEHNQISGRWTERTRGIGGTASGITMGPRLQLHIESSAFAATLDMVTSSSRQSVSIDSHGGGQVVKASITLNRR